MKARSRENDFPRLKEELKAGKIRSVYLFTGSEDFLMEEAAAQIRTAIVADNQDYAVNRVSGKDLPLLQVLDMAETVSLFSESRLVIVSDAPYFAKAGGDEEAFMRLSKFSMESSASCIIFLAPEFNGNIKAYKELTAAGALYRFEPLKPQDINAWLKERLASHGKTAANHVISLLVQRVGRDLRRLASETDKLTVYLGHRKELDETAVMEATARSLQGDIFALTDSVVSGRTAKALSMLRELTGAGEPPLRILAMLVRQFRMLSESMELLRLGFSQDEIAAKLGVPPFVAEKLVLQARKADETSLTRAVDLLMQADLDIKRGRVEQNLTLEALVVALGQKSA